MSPVRTRLQTIRPNRGVTLLAVAGALCTATVIAPSYSQSRMDWPPYGFSSGYGIAPVYSAPTSGPAIAQNGMPAFCLLDHRARGAAIGAQIGEARGGPQGARIGAAIGAARGERIDALCRHIGFMRATRPTPPLDNTPPRASAPARLTPTDDPTRSDQLSRAVGPLSGNTAAAQERCMVSLEVSFAQESGQAPVTGRVCEGPDGQLREKM